MGDLFDVQVARVTDATILDASMERVEGPIAVPQGLASVDVPDAGKPLPRIALMHTWLTTQTEGWWRMELDAMQVPYAYISTQDITHWTGRASGRERGCTYVWILLGAGT